MNRDRYDMLRAHVASRLGSIGAEHRDWLAVEAMLAQAVFDDTIRDPHHRRQVLSVLADLAPSFAAQLNRILNATVPKPATREAAS